MSGFPVSGENSLAKMFRKYRRAIGIFAAVLSVYALAGFFLLPWLIKKNAVEIVADTIGAELRIEKVAVNPFVLSLQVDGVALDDPSGAPVLRVHQIFVNFQLSSLFRWAWTFDEVRIDAPEAFLARDSGGVFNIGFLMPQSGEPEAMDVAETPGETKPARLLIFTFAVNDSVVNWHDEVPSDPVRTRFGPVNIAIAQLNTLPDRAGQQDVVITTETSGTLGWSGSLQLNPLSSAGRASVAGSHFPLTSAYIKHETGFEIVDGTADIDFEYQIAALDDGTIEANISAFNLSFDGVQVRTFNSAFGIDEPDRDVLQLPRVTLEGGLFRWPERTIAAESFSIDDAVVSLYRNESGRLNILPVKRNDEPAVESETGPAAAAANAGPQTDWQLSLSEFRVNRMALALEDHSVDPAAEIGYRSLDISMRDINNKPSAEFPTSLTMLARTEGTLSMDGTIRVLPSPVVNLEVKVDKLALANAHPYLQPLADVNLDSGALNFAGNLAISDSEPLSLAGDLEIVDFLITETDVGSKLGSWATLRANKLALSAANRSLEISEIRLEDAYADILIAEDGSVNLGRAKKGVAQSGEEEVAAGENEADEGSNVAESQSTEDGGDGLPMITVGRVVVANAAADFADFSLPLPFAAKIAELSGQLSTVATASVMPSTVSLEGKVDEFGLVRVTGHATPLDPSANTDINVVFENVQMPKFSAYTIPFAGRKIASGHLDLDLGYKVTASELEGENKIILRDFELGDKVDHPGAMSLPLGLAVALLKDAEGRINIDLPVRGNVDDPEFKYGGVVMKALANLIVGIVASPFKLLANLVGAESSELEYLHFVDGRSDLTGPELEKSVKLSEALKIRPELVLQFGGVVDPEADGVALRTASVETEIEQRIATLTGEETDGAMYTENRFEVIEQMYRESEITADPNASLAEIRDEYTSSAATDASGTEEKFDALAYAEHLRRLLVDRQPLSDQELSELAAARAANAREAIVTASPELGARIEVVESTTVSRDEGEPVRMQMVLTASTAGVEQ
jgi:hypothetical protein